MKVRTSAAALVVTLGAMVGACGDDGSPSVEGVTTTTTADAATTSTTSAVGGDLTFAGLCPAIAAAQNGDVAGAVSVFDHGPLHELAAAAEQIDRAVSAELLVAKEKVESDLGDEMTPANIIVTDLGTLADATRVAQQLVGGPVLPDCGGTDQ